MFGIAPITGDVNDTFSGAQNLLASGDPTQAEQGLKQLDQASEQITAEAKVEQLRHQTAMSIINAIA